jgi:membrane-bound lytic murein transglycosylase D
VAARHGIPLARLKKVNGIGPRTKIRTGQQIVVPVKGSNAAKEPLPAVFQPPAVPEPRTRKVVYTVKKGDTLPTIAHRYRVSTAELRRWNRIGRLTAGQKIVIQKQVAGNTRAPVRKRKTSKAAKPDTRPAAVAKPAQKAGRR